MSPEEPSVTEFLLTTVPVLMLLVYLMMAFVGRFPGPIELTLRFFRLFRRRPKTEIGGKKTIVPAHKQADQEESYRDLYPALYPTKNGESLGVPNAYRSDVYDVIGHIRLVEPARRSDEDGMTNIVLAQPESAPRPVAAPVNADRVLPPILLDRLPPLQGLAPLDALRTLAGFMVTYSEADIRALGQDLLAPLTAVMTYLARHPAAEHRIAALVDAAAPRATEALALYMYLGTLPSMTQGQNNTLIEARNALIQLPGLLNDYLAALHEKDFIRLADLTQQIHVIDLTLDAPLVAQKAF